MMLENREEPIPAITLDIIPPIPPLGTIWNQSGQWNLQTRKWGLSVTPLDLKWDQAGKWNLQTTKWDLT